MPISKRLDQSLACPRLVLTAYRDCGSGSAVDTQPQIEERALDKERGR
jgi:hypothetical protein